MSVQAENHDMYLGDGVYASFDGYQIWLAANNHTNKVIALDPTVMARLARYANAVYPPEFKADTPYNLARIAWELERTAMNDGFYGNALRVAKDIPSVTDDDRALLDRYATGLQTGTDHVALQDLAMRLSRGEWQP